MKKLKIKSSSFFSYARLGMLALLLTSSSAVMAQEDQTAKDTTDEANTSASVVKNRPVKNTFDGNYIIDQQSVMVPIKGTLEFDLQHRFGIVNNGYSDFYGVYAPSIIRLAFEYVPVKNLQLGFGLCKDRMQLDFNGKYALLRQTKGGSPVSVTYYGNIDVDTRAKSNFVTNGDRYSYFNQIIVARKITSNLSVQAALSLSHFNNIAGYIDSEGVVRSTMQNDQFTLSFMGRYKVSNSMSILIDYDQPLTQNLTNNPNPNLAFGLEITTSSHDFQIVVSNCQYILPQNNALYNQNDFNKGQYLIGFNMSRLWNF